MSILFATILSLLIYLWPTVMALYYKCNPLLISIVLIINVFLGILGGIGWAVAFVLTAINIGFIKTIKSVLFAILLCVLVFISGIIELSMILNALDVI